MLKMRTKRRRGFRTTRKQFLDQLKIKYPNCKYDVNRDSHLYVGHDIVYGEMEYSGIQKLYNHLKKYNIDTFIDVGSGRGKLCMYMAAQPKIKYVMGVELVKERHDDAMKLKSELPEEISKKVELLNKNILDVDLKLEGCVFVWFSNLCFHKSITDTIFKKLQELPKGSIICCSKKPNDNNVESIVIEMSWSKTSEVFIYIL
jgi:hypothetical protein